MFAPSAVYSQYTIDTLRHINLIPGGGYSAIWGYTAPDGREYAILGCNGSSGRTPGTSIVDITDDSNVHQVAFIPGLASTWREMKTYRQYAYVVSEASGSGTQIIDLSFLPDSAHLVRTFVYTKDATHNTSKSHTITITDGFMYLNGCANWGTATAQHGMVIFDLRSDPTNPQFIGEYSPDYIHDSYVLRDTIFASAVYANGGVYIADARNKTSIQTIGKISYTGSGTHNSWVTKDRRYVITTDEIGAISPKQLHIWDISNLPTIPTTSVAFTVNPSIVVHNVTVRGDFAYSVWYSGRGLQVVDVTNPLLPTLAAGYQIAGSNALDWGVYPYFPSGKIVMGDGTNGLWVFRFSGLIPRVPVTLLQPANGDTANGSSATFRWTKSADLSKDPHYYEVRLRGPGVDTTWRADDSVSVFNNLAGLQAGQTYWWSVITRDEWNTTASPDSFRIVRGLTTGAGDHEGTTYEFSLSQNYPNPFNPATVIRYNIPSSGHVTLKVLNLLGEEVVSLVNDVRAAGKYEARFDGRLLPSGVYFYRISAPGGFTEIRKMVLLK